MQATSRSGKARTPAEAPIEEQVAAWEAVRNPQPDKAKAEPEPNDLPPNSGTTRTYSQGHAIDAWEAAVIRAARPSRMSSRPSAKSWSGSSLRSESVPRAPEVRMAEV